MIIAGFPNLFPIQLVKNTRKPIDTRMRRTQTRKRCTVSPVKPTKKC